MRIKPKSNIGNLKSDFYEVIAVHKCAQELYLIQDKELQFIWIESSNFDKTTIKNDKHLIKEQHNEYCYYLVPDHLTKPKRKIGDDVYWKLEGNELFERIGFALNFKQNGYKLSNELNELISNENLMYGILEEQVNAYGKLIMLLSDGYFPSIITIQKIQKSSENADIKAQFPLDFKQMRSDHELVTTEIFELKECLTETFDWSYEYVKGFNVCSKIFEDDYWSNQIESLKSTAINNILAYSHFHNFKINEYFLPQFGGTQIKLIQMIGQMFKVTLRIQNVVH